MSENVKQGPHTCGDCGQTFDSTQALAEHRLAANHAAIESDEKIECDRCGFVLETREELQRHMQQMHSAA